MNIDFDFGKQGQYMLGFGSFFEHEFYDDGDEGDAIDEIHPLH